MRTGDGGRGVINLGGEEVAMAEKPRIVRVPTSGTVEKSYVPPKNALPPPPPPRPAADGGGSGGQGGAGSGGSEKSK